MSVNIEMVNRNGSDADMDELTSSNKMSQMTQMVILVFFPQITLESVLPNSCPSLLSSSQTSCVGQQVLGGLHLFDQLLGLLAKGSKVTFHLDSMPEILGLPEE